MGATLLCALTALSSPGSAQDAPTKAPSPPFPTPELDSLEPLPTGPLEPLEPLAVPPLGEGTPLTLEAVVAATLARAPKLESAAQKIRAAEAEVMAAQGAFDTKLVGKLVDVPIGYYDTTRVSLALEQPTPYWGLMLTAGYRRGVGNWPVYYENYETLTAGEAFLGLELPLLRDRAIDAQRAKLLQADLKLKANQRALDANALQTARDAAIAYWGWVAAGRKLAIALRLMALAEQREAAVDALVRSGAIPAAERLENRRVLLGRRQEAIKALRKLEKAAIKLALYLRDANGDPTRPDPRRLPDTLEPPAPLDEGLLSRAPALALENRPEVAQMQATAQIAEIDVELTENQVAPELDLMARTSGDIGDTPKELDKKLGPPIVEWGVTLKVPLQMRKPRGQRDAAQARRAGVTWDNRLAMDTLLNEVEDAISAVEAAQAGVPVARDGARMANLRAEAERRRFIAGSTDLFKVNLLEDYAAQSEAKLVDAIADLHIAHATLRAAIGLAPDEP